MLSSDALKDIIIDAVEDLKAKDIETLNVSSLTTIADYMIICTGTSTRHVKAISDNIIEKIKAAKNKVFGIEGDKDCEWLLVDAGDVIVHIMLPETREFYQLEKLWGMPAQQQQAA